MPLKIEITNRFAEAQDANKLLYTPRAGRTRFVRTKVYLAEIAGDPAAFSSWMRRVILDPISQDLHAGDPPAVPGAAVILEYGMKPGALDHEREMILEEFEKEHATDLGFAITSLRLRTRIYLFGEGGAPVDPAPFVRDVVNPAIHTHSVVC